jgi:uncharacterized protein (DUF2141 family)
VGAGALAHAAPSIDAKLAVTVDGLKPDGGPVRVGLYDEATFPLVADTPLVKRTVDAEASVVIDFERLPPGTYALKAFQDLNGNGKPDPGEPQATSNGAAPGDFDAAAIVLTPGENRAALHLR